MVGCYIRATASRVRVRTRPRTYRYGNDHVDHVGPFVSYYHPLSYKSTWSGAWSVHGVYSGGIYLKGEAPCGGNDRHYENARNLVSGLGCSDGAFRPYARTITTFATGRTPFASWLHYRQPSSASERGGASGKESFAIQSRHAMKRTAASFLSISAKRKLSSSRVVFLSQRLTPPKGREAKPIRNPLSRDFDGAPRHTANKRAATT